ncbi:MAG: hypothetical protein A3H28_02930 [Acidobacteria bacterium RIFCSPLOWO2_02_FULL_61_28]|nr:MAG: hypothetical protein A3H28_02930 [Acidobacteria bacterium RIFCSPLOWO2_02_FULL_61_28]
MKMPRRWFQLAAILLLARPGVELATPIFDEGEFGRDPPPVLSSVGGPLPRLLPARDSEDGSEPDSDSEQDCYCCAHVVPTAHFSPSHLERTGNSPACPLFLLPIERPWSLFHPPPA